MAALDGDDAAWLASPDALPVLAAAAAAWHDARDPLRAAEQLRRDGVAARAAGLALTQVRLRERARARLGSIAERLLLTDDGLAQATRPVVARRRAQRLVAAGVTHVADLGCGLGLDAAAMADAGLRVTAVERDPVVAALARANLAGSGAAAPWRFSTATPPPRRRSTRLLAGGIDAAFVDPARRDPSRTSPRGRVGSTGDRAGAVVAAVAVDRLAARPGPRRRGEAGPR